MKFLIDNALSPDLTVQDCEVLKRAASEDRFLVSADTDFATRLAQTSWSRPSVILFRQQSGRTPQGQFDLLLANLTAFEDAALQGSVIVIEESRMRIRRLPIGEADSP